MLINQPLRQNKKVKARTMLVREGKISKEIFFIRKGCIRAWFNRDGKEITLQFFFEGDTVTSLESFLHRSASNINIETIEACEVQVMNRTQFDEQLRSDAVFKEWFYSTALDKLIVHANRLLFLLKNKPAERYRQLLAENPAILQRVPQHYLASYLGMTPVSLSRIRNRKS